MDKMNDYTIKALKQWTGRDGMGASCTLVCGGVDVATCLDEGCGGAMHIRPLDREALAAFETRVEGLDLRWPTEMGGAEVTFERPAYVVNTLIDEELTRRRFARVCKTSILYRLAGDPKDSYRRMAIPKGRSAAEGCAFVRSHYRDQNVVEIVNEAIAAPSAPARKARSRKARAQATP